MFTQRCRNCCRCMVLLMGLALMAVVPESADAILRDSTAPDILRDCPPPQKGVIQPPWCIPIVPPPPDKVCLRATIFPATTEPPTAYYQIVAQNFGTDDAKYTRLTLLFEPDQPNLLGAEFSQADAWVEAAGSDAATLRPGTLRSGAVVTATVHLRPTMAAAGLHGRVRLRWDGGDTGGNLLSNLVALTLVDGKLVTQPPVLQIKPDTARPDRSLVLYDGFTAYEQIDLWYQAGTTKTAIGRATADAQGSLSYSMRSSALAPGAYTVIAQGMCSGVRASVALLIGNQ